MTFDEWWKQIKPAECDEVKPYFEEAWQTAFRDGYERGCGVSRGRGYGARGVRGCMRNSAKASAWLAERCAAAIRARRTRHGIVDDEIARHD